MLTSNDDLIAAGLAPEDDDDIREDAAVLFGIDVGSGSAALTLIDLDNNGGEGATTTGNPLGSNSNSSTPSVVGNSNVGKRKLPVWANFDEIYETMNGRKICTKATCKMCKTTLSARSSVGTGHLKRHQKSCRQKTDQHARVQSRLAYNPDGFVHNWDYKSDVARSKLSHFIARLDLLLGIGETEA